MHLSYTVLLYICLSMCNMSDVCVVCRYSFNDSYVSECRPQDAVTGQAYVLFYKRRDGSSSGSSGSSDSGLKSAGSGGKSVPLSDGWE